MSEESMMFVGAAALLFFCVLVLHSLWQTGRKYPAAVHARPNGIKGGLFLVVAFLFGVAVVDGGSAANILLFISERTPGGLPADVILRYGTPGIAGSVLCLAAIHRLIVGRDKKARIYATVLMWIAGPVNEMLAFWSQRSNGTEADVLPLAAIGCGVAISTVYLFLSKRSKNTYGLF